MESKDPKSYPSILLCVICKNIYNNARILPCSHSFCYFCLSNVLKNETIICPSCKIVNEIKNLDAIPQNEMINFTIETLNIDKSTIIKCQECDNKIANLHCDNCSFNLCEECSNNIVHLSKNMKNHVFSEVKENYYGNCNIHSGHKNEVFCINCNNLICLKCSILNHKNHDLQEIKIVEKSFKISLEEKIKNQSKLKDFLKESSESLKNMRQSQKIFLNEYQIEIDSINDLMISLENKKKELQSNLEKIRKDQKLKIKLFQNEIDFIGTNLSLYEQSLDKIENIKHLKKIHSDFDSFKAKFDNLKNKINDMKIIKVNSFQAFIMTIKKKFEMMYIKTSDFKISDIKIVDNKILDNKILQEVEFNFSTLGMKGRFGPISLKLYEKTNLEYKVTLIKGIQQWMVPYTGKYRIKAAGAEGGIAGRINPKAGKGSIMEGTFQLEKDTVLKILVGQKGSNYEKQNKLLGGGGGGGGGTFVLVMGLTILTDQLLIIAGGGNGDSWSQFTSNGINARITNNQDIGGRRENGSGRAGAGGSVSSDGQSFRIQDKMEGLSFRNGGLGGASSSSGWGSEGGFGGGGGSEFEGGGGGGYTGGSVVPMNSSNINYDNLGAGSFNKGEDQNNLGGANSGDGFVTIKKIN